LVVPVAYGIVHAVVDASTVGLLFTVIGRHGFDPEHTYFLILLYNFLAFALQPVFGLLTDWVKAPRLTAFMGIFCIIPAFFLYMPAPLIAVILVGTGNALFHIGGGVINLFVTPGRALAPGIFVAPGALGLGIGVFLGKSGIFSPLLFGVLLSVSACLLFVMKYPPTYGRNGRIALRFRLPAAALALFFVSILSRALIGATGGYTLHKTVALGFVLAGAAVLGKGLGGFVSDRFGWLKVSVLALLVSAPLIAFNYGNAVVAVAGLLFFQMTMPVTLTATAGIIPRLPGLAFGLNCLALFIGGLIAYFPLKYAFHNPAAQVVSIILTAVIVFIGLRLLQNKRNQVGGEKRGRVADQGE
jgi:FSR family fosmidomycin resistance protein-like MFS transporter